MTRLVLLAVLLPTCVAQAWVVEVIEGTQIPRRFVERTVTFDLSARPAPAGIDAEQAAAQMLEAMQTWGGLECAGESTPFAFALRRSAEPLLAGQPMDDPENRNVIEWVTDPEDWPHGEFSIANTVLTVDPETGAILDVDIEVNAAHHTWVLDAPGVNEYDLRNAITHETGHVLGLDHSEVESATMHESVQWGETADRQLDPDDIGGYCAIYGPEAPPWPSSTIADASDTGGGGEGCHAGPSGGQGPALGLLLLLAAVSAVSLRKRRTPFRHAPCHRSDS